MEKKKIVYMIFSLHKSGPVNVLYDLVKNIDYTRYDVVIITIKKCDRYNDVERFKRMGITCISMDLGRIDYVINGRRKIKKLLDDIHPDIVHTHCLFSTYLVAKNPGVWLTFATLHCYPHVDFTYEFGMVIGSVMAEIYVKLLRYFDNPIACSEAIRCEMLQKYSLKMHVVRNGTEQRKCIKKIDGSRYRKEPKQKILLCVSCFNKRKNQMQILNCMEKLLLENKIAIVFLGDGKLRKQCEKKELPNTYFVGDVDNVGDYYNIADGIISASKAEGMPMAIIEALLSGVPKYVLSDIEPHKEIKEIFPSNTYLLNFNNDCCNTEEMLKFLSTPASREKVEENAIDKLSAKKWQKII